METLLNKARRIVLKLGTNILTSGIGQLDTDRIAALCQQAAALRARGLEVIIVSSGAVGLGMGKLGLKKRPKPMSALQRCAAVGQPILMETWQKGFAPLSLPTAQILLTREDVRGRQRHLALKELIEDLLANDIVPIINENDSVCTQEIKFGDNDVLSALVASLMQADLLVILSTAPGLVNYAENHHIIPVVEKITPELLALAGGPGSTTSVGGMITKLEAARIATQSGCATFIGSGEDPAILTRLGTGQAIGTFFVPSKIPLDARQRWIAFFQHPLGTLDIDPGACAALTDKGSSLLPKGITALTGQFKAGDIVDIRTPGQAPFARGLSAYDAPDLATALGKNTAQLRTTFPRRKRFEAVHRDSLVMLR